MLSREELATVLEGWSFWKSAPPASLQRNAATTCILHHGVANVITGVRRCGKSTLLHQLMKSNGIQAEKAIFVNFEDPRLAQCLDHPLLEEICEWAEESRKGPLTLFFDEIQHVTNWQKWINSSLERRPEHTFVVTGSNSRLLGGELATSLTGRHLSTELFPFDFDELRRLFPKASLEDFLQKGGFPAALMITEPERLLQQYFFDILEKDVRERVSARSGRPLMKMAQMVFESVGSETSLRRIAGALGLSPETVSVYLQACEDAYLIFSCPYFAYSEAKRARRNKKYYAIDTALRRAVTTRVGADQGKDFENLVYLTLRRKTTEVFYWRGKSEVDFVTHTSNAVTPFQVTYGEPRERHEKGLREFYETFPHAAEAIYVTPDTFEELAGLEL